MSPPAVTMSSGRCTIRRPSISCDCTAGSFDPYFVGDSILETSHTPCHNCGHSFFHHEGFSEWMQRQQHHGQQHMSAGASKSHVAKDKRAAAPAVMINPLPIVQPTVQCPVPGCEVTFAGKDNLRAITIHLKGIVKNGRAYYVLRRQGGDFWDAHNEYYQDKQEQRGKYTEIL
jgi:hypothetical protein